MPSPIKYTEATVKDCTSLDRGVNNSVLERKLQLLMTVDYSSCSCYDDKNNEEARSWSNHWQFYVIT